MAAALKLLKLRLVFGKLIEPELKLKLLPKACVKTVAAAPLKVLCPEAYSGKGGVLIKGCQLGSAIVLALPSRLADLIAVMGRQVS